MKTDNKKKLHKLIALGVSFTASLALTSIYAQTARAASFLVDFETDAAGNPLASGIDIGEQWADIGVHISATPDTNRLRDLESQLESQRETLETQSERLEREREGRNRQGRINRIQRRIDRAQNEIEALEQDIDNERGNFPLRLFNSNCGPDFGVACTGGDDDLATGDTFGTEAQGNVLIINESRNGEPDDFAGGGTLVFEFDMEVTLDSITLLDIDENRGASLNVFDAFGETLATVSGLSSGGDNGLLQHLFDDLSGISRLEVTLPGSGAIASIGFTSSQTCFKPEVAPGGSKDWADACEAAHF
ncbi:MAG: hypothetical protein F6K19_39040 [Cyanothece sp. SIO1E1]|nr:hypothetical protein [Cyanothece sp. SIO1E1]